MPLSKQAKALYEAALRRKGLQPGKAVYQDPRKFVGPIKTHPESRSSPLYNPDYHRKPDVVQVPSDNYWNSRGRFQDLEDELRAAAGAGVWHRKNPVGGQYYQYYNDGDIPRIMKQDRYSYYFNEGYGDPDFYRYYVPRYYEKPVKVPGYGQLYENVRRRGTGTPHLTRLGELELEARADEAIENEYKNYLREMYSRYPSRRDAINEIQEHRLRDTQFYPYFEGLFPEEY